MTFKTLLTIHSLMAFSTGIACVLVPESLLSMYGITLMPMGIIIYQLLGATLIGVGLLTWFARHSKELGVQKAYALSLFVTYGISSVIAIRGQFAGANDVGWSTVILYLFFVVGFGYFQFFKFRPSESIA